MRTAVLDVGSNTVHLLAADVRHGAAPIAIARYRQMLRLAELLDDDDAITKEGERRLVAVIAEAAAVARDARADELLAFATSAIREASNGPAVVDRIRRSTSVELELLDGVDEARLTFLAARRWFGWAGGRLLVLDIGGGSLEMSIGSAEEPEVALSLRLGAGRLTRDWLPDDPPTDRQMRSLEAYVEEQIQAHKSGLLSCGVADLPVATSKTFRSLARIGGAAPYRTGIYTPRRLTYPTAREIRQKVASLSIAHRARLPGVSPARAPQLAAGALVAEVAMRVLGVTELAVCPWALREGVILRRLDWTQW